MPRRPDPSASDPHVPRPPGSPGTVVITGASAGIGAAAARHLGAVDARVVVVGRDPDRTAAVARDVGAEALVADFSRLDDVRALAEELRRRCPRIDVLANNAGGTWPRAATTVDGHERTLQVNHLAPYLLTRLLEDRLAPGGRVVTTSSSAHLLGRLRAEHLAHDLAPAGRHVATLAYARSKLANILFTRELARRWAPLGVAATSFHPGAVATGLGRAGGLAGLLYRTPLQRLLRTPEEGAATLVWLATAPAGTGWVDGGHHDGFGPGRTSAAARDGALAAALWDVSARMVGLPA